MGNSSSNAENGDASSQFRSVSANSPKSASADKYYSTSADANEETSDDEFYSTSNGDEAAPSFTDSSLDHPLLPSQTRANPAFYNAPASNALNSSNLGQAVTNQPPAAAPIIPPPRQLPASRDKVTPADLAGVIMSIMLIVTSAVAISFQLKVAYSQHRNANIVITVFLTVVISFAALQIVGPIVQTVANGSKKAR